MKIDIGDLCTHCGKDTAMGSSELLFVNRIPSDADGKLVLGGGDDITINVGIEGYMCIKCQSIECDACDKSTPDYEIINGQIFCEDCLEGGGSNQDSGCCVGA